MCGRLLPRLSAILTSVLFFSPVLLAGPVDLDRAPINYSKAKPDNAITRLQDRLAAGKARLTFEEDRGYLQSVLKELSVPESSQGLVFSKTSLQRERISPK